MSTLGAMIRARTFGASTLISYISILFLRYHLVDPSFLIHVL